MSTQTQTYEFLSHPPLQKKRFMLFSKPESVPLRQPPTPVGASHGTSKKQAIENWASKVLPGSPSASPITPTSGPSTDLRRFSVSSIRRVSSSGRPRAASISGVLANLIHTPGTDEMNPTTADYAALGYTSFFVTLPPTSPKTAVPIPAAARPKPKPSLAGKALDAFAITARRRRSASSPLPPPPAPASAPQPPRPSPIPQLTFKKGTHPPRTPISPDTALRRKRNRNAGLPSLSNVTNQLTVMQLFEEIADVERKHSDASMTTMQFEPAEPTTPSRPSTPRRLDRLRPAPLNLDQPKRRLRGVDAVAVNDSALSAVTRPVKQHVDELGNMLRKGSLSNLKVFKFKGRK